MCGIIGIINRKESELLIPELIESLKRLDYRGYDSWGYAFLNGKGIETEKRVGRITKPSLVPASSVAISHTRWATHGGVTEANAHPHLDCKRQIAVVHNGIIENYLELQEMLIKKGHIISSQTDSEVIAHILEEQHGSLYEKMKNTIKFLKGSFAIVAIDGQNPKEMVAIKNESPLVIGFNGDEIIFASDTLAFLNRMNEAIYVSEGEVACAEIKNSNVVLKFFDSIKNMEIKKAGYRINWKAEHAELGESPHYMLKEIFEQVKALTMITNESAEKLAEEMKGRKIYAIACGTARHAAVIGKHILHKVAGYTVDVMMAHEFSYFVDDVPEDSVILAVSQSGETADVMECVRKAKKRGMKIISIVNVPSSTLARESEYVLYTNCGPEIAVASTKAFTSQVAAFYLIAYSMIGKNITQKIDEIAAMLEKQLPYFDQKAREIAEYLKNKLHVYMLGKGVNFPIALEGALKLKEISYIHAEGMPAGELKHGTLALVEKETPVILICPSDYTYNDSISNGLETKARGAYIIGISNRPHPSFNMWVKLPELNKEDEIFYPLLETIPLQLIAYHTAVVLGRDVDKPRNLAKSVTVK